MSFLYTSLSSRHFHARRFRSGLNWSHTAELQKGTVPAALPVHRSGSKSSVLTFCLPSVRSPFLLTGTAPPIEKPPQGNHPGRLAMGALWSSINGGQVHRFVSSKDWFFRKPIWLEFSALLMINLVHQKISARSINNFSKRCLNRDNDFDPARGHEIRKTRPAVVVQNDSGNQYSPLKLPFNRPPNFIFNHKKMAQYFWAMKSLKELRKEQPVKTLLNK